MIQSYEKLEVGQEVFFVNTELNFLYRGRLDRVGKQRVAVIETKARPLRAATLKDMLDWFPISLCCNRTFSRKELFLSEGEAFRFLYL